MSYDDEMDRPLFMISVAAELAGMHPQTLRIYERRGLLLPQRSAKNTRRYSRRDVERLRRIQELTELGLNLAGVERVLAMEEQLAAMAARARRPARAPDRGRRRDAARRCEAREGRTGLDLVPVRAHGARARGRRRRRR